MIHSTIKSLQCTTESFLFSCLGFCISSQCCVKPVLTCSPLSHFPLSFDYYQPNEVSFNVPGDGSSACVCIWKSICTSKYSCHWSVLCVTPPYCASGVSKAMETPIIKSHEKWNECSKPLWNLGLVSLTILFLLLFLKLEVNLVIIFFSLSSLTILQRSV